MPAPCSTRPLQVVPFETLGKERQEEPQASLPDVHQHSVMSPPAQIVEHPELQQSVGCAPSSEALAEQAPLSDRVLAACGKFGGVLERLGSQLACVSCGATLGALGARDPQVLPCSHRLCRECFCRQLQGRTQHPGAADGLIECLACKMLTSPAGCRRDSAYWHIFGALERMRELLDRVLMVKPEPRPQLVPANGDCHPPLEDGVIHGDTGLPALDDALPVAPRSPEPIAGPAICAWEETQFAACGVSYHGILPGTLEVRELLDQLDSVNGSIRALDELIAGVGDVASLLLTGPGACESTESLSVPQVAPALPEGVNKAVIGMNTIVDAGAGAIGTDVCVTITSDREVLLQSRLHLADALMPSSPDELPTIGEPTERILQLTEALMPSARDGIVNTAQTPVLEPLPDSTMPGQLRVATPTPSVPAGVQPGSLHHVAGATLRFSATHPMPLSKIGSIYVGAPPVAPPDVSPSDSAGLTGRLGDAEDTSRVASLLCCFGSPAPVANKPVVAKSQGQQCVMKEVPSAPAANLVSFGCVEGRDKSHPEAFDQKEACVQNQAPSSKRPRLAWSRIAGLRCNSCLINTCEGDATNMMETKLVSGMAGPPAERPSAVGFERDAIETCSPIGLARSLETGHFVSRDDTEMVDANAHALRRGESEVLCRPRRLSVAEEFMDPESTAHVAVYVSAVAHSRSATVNGSALFSVNAEFKELHSEKISSSVGGIVVQSEPQVCRRPPLAAIPENDDPDDHADTHYVELDPDVATAMLSPVRASNDVRVENENNCPKLANLSAPLVPAAQASRCEKIAGTSFFPLDHMVEPEDGGQGHGSQRRRLRSKKSMHLNVPSSALSGHAGSMPPAQLSSSRNDDVVVPPGQPLAARKVSRQAPEAAAVGIPSKWARSAMGAYATSPATLRRAFTAPPESRRQRLRLFILFTNFPKQEVDRYRRSVHRLGGVVVKEFPTAPDKNGAGSVLSASDVRVVTRHSSPAPQQRIALSRTMKYFDALVAGAWVVSPDWILASCAAGSWLPEESFELTGDVAHECAGGPARGRSHGPRLFSGLRLHFPQQASALHRKDTDNAAIVSPVAPCDLPLGDDVLGLQGPKPKDLQRLARRGGAEILFEICAVPVADREPDYLSPEALAALSTDLCTGGRERRTRVDAFLWRRPVVVSDSACKAASDLGWMVLPSGWMIDSISCGKLMAPKARH